MRKELKDILEQIESARQLITRLEKVADKMDETYGNMSLMELLEEEIQDESPYAERGYIGLTGSQTLLKWPFKKVIDSWVEIYEEDGEEGRQAMLDQAQEFQRLSGMFVEATIRIKT